MPHLTHLYSLLRYIQRRYVADGCSNSAAALTYMSLFALVPLVTVMYAMLSAVPAFQDASSDIQSFIFSHFVPAAGQEVQEYLQEFSDKARKLTGVGVIFLAVTALLMLKNIEKTFNAIWRTRGHRRGVASFLLYWAILSLGPLFLGAALGISTYLVSLQLFTEVDTLGVTQQLLALLPMLLTSAAFTLLFTAVPNCRVPLHHALAGGVVTALVFEIAKRSFTAFVANSSFQSIYGTFATIPLFLLWIYMSWLIVLAGAELVQALSGHSGLSHHPYNTHTEALALLDLLWQKHHRGELLRELEVLGKPWLLGQHSMSAESWKSLRDTLLDTGLLRTADDGFVLGRDLSQITLWQLLQLLQHIPGPEQSNPGDAPAWFARSQQLLENFHQHGEQALSLPLTSLFELESHETDLANSNSQRSTG